LFLCVFVRFDPDCNKEPLVAVADQLGRSALHFAALYNNPSAARLLSRKLPDLVAMQDMAGMTAQAIAACSGFAEVCEILSHAMADAADHSCECKRWKPLAAEGTGGEEPRAETGGWSVDQLPSSSHNNNADGVCEIDQRGADLTAAEFYQDYVLQRRPVVIRGGALGWKQLRESWAKSPLVRKYGALKFPVSSIPYSNGLGNFGSRAVEEMRLKDYVADGLGALDVKTHKYLFEGIDGKEYETNTLMQQLLSDVPSPSFMSRADWAADGGATLPQTLPYPRTTLTQFYLGGPGTGAQVSAVRCAVVYYSVWFAHRASI
jgi:hypothetical protein